jgi:hypothetical protein
MSEEIDLNDVVVEDTLVDYGRAIDDNISDDDWSAALVDLGELRMYLNDLEDALRLARSNSGDE